MAQTTQRRPRTNPPSRFTRNQARQLTSTPRGAGQRPGRFARPSQRPAARTTIITRGRRQQSKPSGLAGLVSSLPKVGGGGGGRRSSSSGSGVKGVLAALPGVAGGAKKGRRSSSGGGGRKAGGAALLAGAAGLALKNRGKLGSLLGADKADERRDDDAAPFTATGPGVASVPSSPPDVTPADVISPADPATKDRSQDVGRSGLSDTR